MAETVMTRSTEDLAEAVMRAVQAHPAVARLDGGAFGVVATYLPGRRIVGVRVPQDDSPLEISVVMRTGHRIPDAACDIRSLVRGIVGDIPVDLTITDLAEPNEETGSAP